MKNFFDGCSTVEEIKARYKALAKKYHPDLGGGQGIDTPGPPQNAPECKETKNPAPSV